MDTPRGSKSGRLAALSVFLCIVAVLSFAVAGCNDQLTRMEDNQVRLQAMVAANARQLATVSSQVHAGTGKLSEGIRGLDEDTQQVAAEVQAVQDEQIQLRDTLVSASEGLNTRITQLDKDQQSLKDDVAAVAGVANRTASDVTTLAQEQTELHETVRVNQQELTGDIQTMVANQQRIQTGVAHLQDMDKTLAGDVAALAAKHDAMYATMQDHNGKLNEQIAALGAGHDRLSGDIGNVHGLMQVLATNVTGIADEQTHLYAAMQSQTETLTDELAIAEQTRQDMQAGIERVASTAGKTAADVTAIAAGQSAMREIVGANHGEVTGRMDALSQDQQVLRADLGALDDKVDRAAADSTAATSSLQEKIRMTRDILAGQMAAGTQNQQAIQASVQDLHGRAEKLATDLNAISAEQRTLRGTVTSNHDAILAAAAGLSNEQMAIRNSLSGLHEKADATVAGLAAAQKSLGQALQSHNEALVTHTAELVEGQRTVRSQLDVLTATTGQTAIDVLQLADGQTDLRQAVTTGNEALVANTAKCIENQQTLRTGIDTLDQITHRMAEDIITMASSQDVLRQTIAASHEDAGKHMTQLAEQQSVLQSQVDTLTATAGQTGLDVIALGNAQVAMQDGIGAGQQALLAQLSTVASNQQVLRTDIGAMGGKADEMTAGLGRLISGQASLQQALSSHDEAAASRIAKVTAGQEAAQAHLDVLTATAGQTNLDVIALQDLQSQLAQTAQAGTADLTKRTESLASELQKVAAGQTAMQDRMGAGQEALSAHMSTVAANQQVLRTDLAAIDGKTVNLAAELSMVATGQTAMAAALNRHNETVSARVTNLADTQQQMQSGLDILMGTTGQTALDVLEMAARQETVRTAVQGYAEAANNRAAGLSDNQQAVQNNLDIITATAGQVALDVIALSNSQAALEQAVQANRQEFAAKLAGMTDSQQAWREQLDGAQAKVQIMAQGVEALEKRMTTLRDAVQTALENVATLVDTTGQERTQFEAKVSQDMQAMVEAVSGLRQMQTLLQEQMTQIHKSTESQTESLKAAIEQMKQAPAELKVSDAAKVETTAQTGE